MRLSSINQHTAGAREDVEKRKPTYTVGGNADWCSHCGKQYERSSQNLKMGQTYDPAILLLGTQVYLKKPKTLIRKNIRTLMFTAALLTIAKIRKQRKCPSIEKWIKSNGACAQWNITRPLKNRNLAICDSTDGPRVYYAKGSQTEKDKTIWFHL